MAAAAARGELEERWACGVAGKAAASQQKVIRRAGRQASTNSAAVT